MKIVTEFLAHNFEIEVIKIDHSKEVFLIYINKLLHIYKGIFYYRAYYFFFTIH